MRTLPQLVFSRQDWGILFPHVGMSDAEMDDLAAATGPYIAGSVAIDCVSYTGKDVPLEQQVTVQLRLNDLCKRRKPKQKKNARRTPQIMPVIVEAHARRPEIPDIVGRSRDITPTSLIDPSLSQV